MRRLAAGPDRWRWVLLGSLLGHVLGLVVMRALAGPAAHPTPRGVSFEVRRAAPPERGEHGQATSEEADEPPTLPTERVKVVAAHDRVEAPARPTENEAARDQRARDAESEALGLRPGNTATTRPSPRLPTGSNELVAQEGRPLSMRGGLRPGEDRLASGRRSGGGTPPTGGGAGSQGRWVPGGRPRAAGAEGAVQARVLTVPWSPLAVRVRLAGPSTSEPRTPAHAGIPGPRTRSTSAARPQAPPGPRPPRPEADLRPVAAAVDPVDGARPLRRPDPLGDPVAELREALGWGPLDRSTLAPRPSSPGDGRAGGGVQGGGPSVPDADSWVRAEDARGSELGAWAELVDARVHARWQQLDLPMDERARGLQGEVTVRYQVHPSGRVRGVTVVRSSGHPSLDALAVAAVPARLPRPPAAARPDGLVYEHTLGYRNPLVLVSPP